MDGELQENLISIPRLDDNGCKSTIENNKLTVEKNYKLILSGEKTNGLYITDFSGAETALLTDPKPKDREHLLRRAHNRAGHRSLLRIQKYIKDESLKLDLLRSNISEQEIKSLPLCDSCERAKFTKRRLRRQELVATAKGKSVSTDMKGPFINGEGHKRRTLLSGVY